MATRESILLKAQEGKIRWKQAAAVLGITPRQLRRIRRRYEEQGPSGLADKRRGSPRQKRIPEEMVERLCALKRGVYSDFSVSHFYDEAVTKFGLVASYEWTLRMLQDAGIVEKTKRRGTYRRRRPRQPMVGMRMHTDGSTHPWLGPTLPVWDLVIMLDDADGRLLAARFVPEESVMSTLQLLEEVVTKHGRFGELYHDRGSMYCHTSDAAIGPDPQQKGQIPRVLEELGIGQIWAYSPQARGRCERAFGTIQGRLCPELQKEGITDYETANAYLQDVFMPFFNQRFTVAPQEPESAFVKLDFRKETLRLLLSAQHQRIVQNDYTVHYDAHILQLPEPSDKRPLCRKKVTVHELTNGNLAVSHNHKVLAYFEAQGDWKTERRLSMYSPRNTSSPPRPQRAYDQGSLAAALRNNGGDTIIRRHDLYVPDWTTDPHTHL